MKPLDYLVTMNSSFLWDSYIIVVWGYNLSTGSSDAYLRLPQERGEVAWKEGRCHFWLIDIQMQYSMVQS